MTAEQDRFNAKLDDLQKASEAILKEMECPHRSSEWGNCEDCMNTGYAVTCQEELDLVEALAALGTIVKHMKGPNNG